jgi:hypothetical protein
LGSWPGEQITDDECEFGCTLEDAFSFNLIATPSFRFGDHPPKATPHSLAYVSWVENGYGHVVRCECKGGAF